MGIFAVLIACMNQQNFPRFMIQYGFVTVCFAGYNEFWPKRNAQAIRLYAIWTSVRLVAALQLAQIFHGTNNILFIYFCYLFIYVFSCVVVAVFTCRIRAEHEQTNG